MVLESTSAEFNRKGASSYDMDSEFSRAATSGLAKDDILQMKLLGY